jgi:hypothetical protein
LKVSKHPTIPSNDYPWITFVPLTPEAAAGRLTTASGQRESATNRLGEHGGMGLGPMRQKCKGSPRRSRLMQAAFLFSVT